MKTIQDVANKKWATRGQNMQNPASEYNSGTIEDFYPRSQTASTLQKKVMRRKLRTQQPNNEYDSDIVQANQPLVQGAVSSSNALSGEESPWLQTAPQIDSLVKDIHDQSPLQVRNNHLNENSQARVTHPAEYHQQQKLQSRRKYLEQASEVHDDLDVEYQRKASMILNANDLDDNTKFYLISTLQMRLKQEKQLRSSKFINQVYNQTVANTDIYSQDLSIKSNQIRLKQSRKQIQESPLKPVYPRGRKMQADRDLEPRLSLKEEDSSALRVHKRYSVNQRRQTSPDPISRTLVKSNLRSGEQHTGQGLHVNQKIEKRRRYIPNKLFAEENEDTYESGHEYLGPNTVKKPRSNTAHAANPRIRDNAINQNFSQIIRPQESAGPLKQTLQPNVSELHQNNSTLIYHQAHQRRLLQEESQLVIDGTFQQKLSTAEGKFEWDLDGRRQPKGSQQAESVKVQTIIDQLNNKNKKIILRNSSQERIDEREGGVSDRKHNAIAQTRKFIRKRIIQTIEQKQLQPRTGKNKSPESMVPLTEQEKKQRLQKIKNQLHQNFGANLLVEKEFGEAAPKSPILVSKDGQNEQVRSSIRSTSRKKSPVRRDRLQDSKSDNNRKCCSPKRKHYQDEKKRSSSPARHLMQALTDFQAPVTDDTILLINAAEVLARDGIHGKISAVGVGFGTGRHTSVRRCGSAAKGPYKKSPLRQETKKTQSVANEAAVEKQSIGVSARTQTKVPSQASIGISNKSPVSQRDRIEQVTEGRFEPAVFDAIIQTDPRSLQPVIQTQTIETATEPIKIVSPKKFSTFMVQTDPMVDEMASLDQPFAPMMPHLAELTEMLMFEPNNEMIAAIELPQPQEPEEDLRDWAESALFAFVESEFLRLQEGNGAKAYDSNFDNLNPLNLPILTETECDYIRAVIFKESQLQEQQSQIKDPEGIFEKAKVTIEVLINNMVNSETVNNTFFSHYREYSKDNLVKLLLRAKQLYETRMEAMKILKLCLEVEQITEPRSTYWRVLQENNPDFKLPECHKQLALNLVTMLSKCLTQITVFQEERHNFKKEFIFRKTQARQNLHKTGAVTNGFLATKGIHNGSLKINGLVAETESDDEEQKRFYEEWYSMTLDLTGKLDYPEVIEYDQESGDKRVKGKRVNRVLEEYFNEEPELIEVQIIRPQHVPITPQQSQTGSRSSQLQYSDEENSNTFDRNECTESEVILPSTRVDQIKLPIDLSKIQRNQESPLGSPQFNEDPDSLQYNDHRPELASERHQKNVLGSQQQSVQVSQQQKFLNVEISAIGSVEICDDSNLLENQSLNRARIILDVEEMGVSQSTAQQRNIFAEVGAKSTSAANLQLRNIHSSVIEITDESQVYQLPSERTFATKRYSNAVSQKNDFFSQSPSQINFRSEFTLPYDVVGLIVQEQSENSNATFNNESQLSLSNIGSKP